MAHHHHHDHDHGHGHDHHHHGQASTSVLRRAFLLTLGFAAVEAVAGWWAGSLALMGDAGHMVTDSAAIGIAWAAAHWGAKPGGERHTFGLGRVEVLAAGFNALTMAALMIFLVVEAIARFQAPHAIDGATVVVVALIGLAVNIVVALTLSGGDPHDLNQRGALLHVLGDLFGSVMAILSGAAVLAFGWLWVDPLLSLAIALLIGFSAYRLLRASIHVLMEGVPSGLDLEEVGHAMATCPGVKEVHDLHLWSIDGGKSTLTAHVVVEDLAQWPESLGGLRHMLHDRFKIEHVTIQPEPWIRPLRPMQPEPHGGDSD
ncbi:MAG: cation transporter [Alphaproteobacteria bacterium CG_4_10_14_0_2_um_filter_63_37]|nr:MAG: hypothetical protein AUJ55_05960 [Proteobacteria bacterium CG1_02_64_396]PJA25357.1 MAG: cation transporter [Alphaproteobacteria bacterium CG_4_10_14_0_2_um_filter_63_37]